MKEIQINFWKYIVRKLNEKSSREQLLDRVLQNLGAAFQFLHGHELAGAVRLANVARSNHDRIAAERLHLRAFGAERDGAGFAARLLFQQPYQRRLAPGFETGIRASGVDFTHEIGIAAFLFTDCQVEEMQKMV